MFGVPSSFYILKKINSYLRADKNQKKYRVIITPPFTLIESFSKKLKKSLIKIGAQTVILKTTSHLTQEL